MGFDDSVESRLHLHRMRFRREVFQDGRPTVLTEPLAQAGISHQRCDRCGQLLRAARFMEESVLAVLDILGRAAVASSDDRHYAVEALLTDAEGYLKGMVTRADALAAVVDGE